MDAVGRSVYLWREWRDPSRLGFAVHLAYLRFPGRVLGAQEDPPSDMLVFIASQIGIAAEVFAGYARRDETRRAHFGEIQTYLGVRSFQRGDYRGIARVAIEAATGTDRGDIIGLGRLPRQNRRDRPFRSAPQTKR
jgi:hypothetical protein